MTRFSISQNENDFENSIRIVFFLFCSSNSIKFQEMSPEKMCYEKKDDSKKLAALTFFAKSCGDICGSNGLPITPYSIGILGEIVKFLLSK